MKIKTLLFFLFLAVNSYCQDTLSEYMVRIKAPSSLTKEFENFKIKLKNESGKEIDLFLNDESEEFIFKGKQVPYGVYTCYFSGKSFQDSTTVIIKKNSRAILHFESDLTWKISGAGYSLIDLSIAVYDAKGDTLRDAIVELKHLELESSKRFQTRTITQVPSGVNSLIIRNNNKIIYQDTLNFTPNPTYLNITIGSANCRYIHSEHAIQPIILVKDTYLATIPLSQPEKVKSFLKLAVEYKLNAPTYSQITNDDEPMMAGATCFHIAVKANSLYSAFNSKSLEAFRNKGYSCGPKVIGESKENGGWGTIDQTIHVQLLDKDIRVLTDFCKKNNLTLKEELYSRSTGYFTLSSPAGTGWGILDLCDQLNNMTDLVRYANPGIHWISNDYYLDNINPIPIGD